MMLRKLPKALLLVFWLAALVNLVMPFASPWGLVINALAGVLLLVHLVEILIFHKRLAAQQEPMRHCLYVLLFGVLHLQQLH
jgi:putative membrane protein